MFACRPYNIFWSIYPMATTSGAARLKRRATYIPLVVRDRGWSKVSMSRRQNLRYDVRSSSAALESDSSWSWGGCSADIKYAGDFSRRLLVGKVEAMRDLNAAMNRHNNNVGRAAVRKSLLRACKCHGPSGTCTTKTCWLQPGELSAVGRRLRKAYDRAHLVNVNRGVPKWPAAKRVLVYAVPADNYCLPNRSLDTTGTYGRECSRRTGSGVSRTERDSCKNLCYNCGYGVRQVAVTTRSSCNCRFLWCCSVKCDSCDINVTKYFCH
ncbi:protein Wnt-8b-like [Dermacentor variabilis]|uniref:protein Wnt-8b-like n=1 Tax=Dermacentor variabilis TaxID=34621 RepID=UPI003F5B5FEB